jgi:predicted ATPase
VLHHDKARRFITLIDEIYDAGARLVWAAEKHPSELFIGVAEQVLAAELERGALVNDSAWETDAAKAPAPLRSSEIQSRPCINE